MISRADNRRFQLRGIPILVAGALALATPTRGDQPVAANIAHFESKIRPVLVNHCYECHSAGSDEIKGGLTLDTRDGIRGGSETGPAVVPGDVDESLILEALRHDGLEMPPDMRLPDRMIADFETWIARGAPDPRDGTTPAVASTVGTDVDLDTGRRHWAFQPPRRPDVPAPPDYLANRVRTPIDVYVALRLAEQGLNFAADADRRTLIRRLYFDLIGLPPTPAEVDTFLADESPVAYERLVDYLLASPHFGERWGRHWLDAVGYCDSIGFDVNPTGVLQSEGKWRYRDYVIQALNKDKPFDRFVQEQLAGDELVAWRDAPVIRPKSANA